MRNRNYFPSCSTIENVKKETKWIHPQDWNSIYSGACPPHCLQHSWSSAFQPTEAECSPAPVPRGYTTNLGQLYHVYLPLQYQLPDFSSFIFKTLCNAKPGTSLYPESHSRLQRCSPFWDEEFVCHRRMGRAAGSHTCVKTCQGSSAFGTSRNSIL